MKLFYKIILFLPLFFSAFLIAQTPVNHLIDNDNEPCKFDEIHQEKMTSDSQYNTIVTEFNEKLANGEISLQKSGDIFQVPVVVHVLYTNDHDLTDSEVEKGIEYLNNYWRKVAGTEGDNGPGPDMEIEFSLAVRDPDGNCTNGIVRRDMNGNSSYVNDGVGSPGITDNDAKTGGWPSTDYYNIYLVNKIDGSNCFSGGSYTAGYAYFAGAHGASFDGTVCLMCSYVDESSNTMAHELGHGWNLYHTFESCSEADCSTGGDRVCDTSPHQQNDCSSTSCVGSGTFDNSRFNYMSYCNTTERFTEGQKVRAHAAMTNIRSSFLESNGNLSLVPPSPPTVDFAVSAQAVCLGSSIKFTDNSTCIPNTYSTSTGFPNHTFQWTFDGPTTFTSSDQNPNITFNTAGTYSVTLEITNAQGTFSETKTSFITVSDSPIAACTPSSNNEGNFAQTVYNVDFKDINNSTSTITNSSYTDFSCNSTTTVYADSTYPISVSVRAGGSGIEHFQVWIDYNDNGAWDAGEQVFSGNSGTTSTTATVTGQVTMPAGAVQDKLLRMRVAGETSNPPSAGKINCSSNYFVGDVEDYSILIQTADEPTEITINSTPSDLTLECDQSTDPAQTGEVTASTSCLSGGLQIDFDDVSTGTCPETITRTWTITDDCSNEETYEQIITLEDTTDPSGDAPGDVVVECESDIPAPDVSSVSNLSDNCTVTPNVTFISDNSDGLSCPETITRTYRITDDCNNFTDVSQTITVNDTQAPSVVCGAVTDEIFTGTGTAALPDYTSGSSISDNCTAFGDLVISQNPNSGTVLTVGIHTVTVSASDLCGNIASCDVEVEISEENNITQVRSDYCGATLSAMGSNIYADPVSGAVMYRYRIDDGTDVTIYDRDKRFFNLFYAGANLAYGTTYNVDVAVDMGSGFGAFGSVCGVTTPSLPLTQLRSDYCDITIPSLGSNIYADAVTGAVMYRYRIDDGTDVTIYDRNKRFFNLVFAGVNLNYETIYTIDVAFDMGSGFGSFGPLCTITTPTESQQVLVNNTITELQGVELENYLSQIGMIEDYTGSNKKSLIYEASKMESYSASLYPNPSNNGFALELNYSPTPNEDYEITISDALGNIVFKNMVNSEQLQNKMFGKDFSKGVYQVHLSSKDHIQYMRFIKN